MPRFLIQATLSGSKRSIVFGFIVGIGITVALPYPAFGARSSGGSRRSKAASVHRSFVAAPSFVSSGRFSVGVAHGASVRFSDLTRHRQHFVSHLSTALDFLVWLESARSQSFLFTCFTLHRPLSLDALPPTGFTFSHGGWMAGMASRFYNQGIGPTLSNRRSVDGSSC